MILRNYSYLCTVEGGTIGRHTVFTLYAIMEKKYKAPPIVWLKVTDYMHGWLQHELGGSVRVREQRVVSVQHLPGARAVLRMETVEDMMEKRPVDNAMSATRHGCYTAGLALDADVMKKEYGVTREQLQLFVPVECPKMCLTKNGVLRPWTNDVCLGKEQASALMRIIRDAFWQAVTEYDQDYAQLLEGKSYPAVDMIEAFCKETETSDMYVDAMRREWQRRQKRNKKGTP